jgi:hypothetical protein
VLRNTLVLILDTKEVFKILLSLRKIILCRVTQGKMHQLRLFMGISRMQGELEVPKIYTIFFNLFCIQDINYN